MSGDQGQRQAYESNYRHNQLERVDRAGYPYFVDAGYGGFPDQLYFLTDPDLPTVTASTCRRPNADA